MDINQRIVSLLATLAALSLLAAACGDRAAEEAVADPDDAAAEPEEATDPDEEPDWEPTRPVQFVIQTSPGGGSDVYARNWIGIIEQYDLSPQPFVPVNMPGGAGAVALAHLASQAGDPHFISPTLNSIITTPLQQEIPVMYPSEDLTPIVKMMMDPFFLVVHPDNWTTWEEFHEECQERALTAVGTGSQQEDEIQIVMIEEAAGCQPFRYIPAEGGGDVASQVAGGHADFNVNQPAEMLPHYPDNLVPLVTFTPERSDAFPDLPTHWELDLNGEWGELLDIETGLHQMRGIMGPPDMPEEAVRWYEDLFLEVWETPEWQEFMEQGAMHPVFMTSDEYRDFLIEFEDNHVTIMRDVAGWDVRPDLRDR
jgi:putative tricarboxylic transport membrane protein